MLKDFVLKAGFLNQILIHGLHFLIHGGTHVMDCFVELALRDEALSRFRIDIFSMVSLMQYTNVEFVFQLRTWVSLDLIILKRHSFV